MNLPPMKCRLCNQHIPSMEIDISINKNPIPLCSNCAKQYLYTCHVCRYTNTCLLETLAAERKVSPFTSRRTPLGIVQELNSALIPDSCQKGCSCYINNQCLKRINPQSTNCSNWRFFDD